MSKAENRFETQILTLTYLERGGTITVCKTGRKTAANSSWTGIRADVGYRGKKANALRSFGYAKAK